MTFAFVFPGQGSQSVGMLNSISERPEVRATLQEASEALGEDVTKLIAEGPAEALALTTNTQPVMLTAAVAFYRAWLAAGGATAPVTSSISGSITSATVLSALDGLVNAIPQTVYGKEDLFELNELYNSWHHHSKFSNNTVDDHGHLHHQAHVALHNEEYDQVIYLCNKAIAADPSSPAAYQMYIKKAKALTSTLVK